MSRYKQYFYTQYNPQQVNDFINQYMSKEGFYVYNNNGETCWKKGVGMMTAPQFLKIYQENGAYVLEAWIKYPLFPGVYVGEMGITGFFAALPKSMLKTRVDIILRDLQAQLLQKSNPDNQQVPQSVQNQYSAPVQQNNQTNQ